MRTRSAILASALAVLTSGCLGASVQGPVSGRVRTTDGRALEDVVVHLRCAGHGVRTTHTTDTETRVVATGETYRFLWAYRGLDPQDCYVRAIHPLYLAYTHAIHERTGRLPDIVLEPWSAFFERGPTYDRLVPRWPIGTLQLHFDDLAHRWLPGFSGRERARLVRYLPDLHALFDRGRLASEPPHGVRSHHARDMLINLRHVERETRYAFSQDNLARAAAAGNSDRVRDIAASGAPLDWWDDRWQAPLHLAAAHGHTDTVRALLDAGAAIEVATAETCDTPLAQALEAKHWDTVSLLLARGADPALGCPERRALGWQLYEEARTGDLEDLQTLLDAGVHPDTPTTGDATALIGAAEAGPPESVRMLLEAGADPNASDAVGRTPLGEARRRRDPELIRLLEGAGALR